MRSIAPPEVIQAQLAAVVMPAHCRHPGTRRDVVARRQLDLCQQQLEGACQAGEVVIEGEAASHSFPYSSKLIKKNRCIEHGHLTDLALNKCPKVLAQQIL